MASVSDFVSDVTPREREELNQILREGEQLRWVVRPLVKRGAEELFDYLVIESFALPFTAIFLYAAYGLMTSTGRGNAFLGPVLSALIVVFFVGGALAVGVFMVLTPWRRRQRRRRTLYVLTNHRATVSEPGYLGAWNTETWPLHEHMLHARICRPGGAGDLIFKVEPSQTGSGELYEYGFRFLPDLQRAHRELNEAVAALMDAAEQHHSTP